MRLLSKFFRARPYADLIPFAWDEPRYTLRITASQRKDLVSHTVSSRAGVREPLALLYTRFASEDGRSVIVGVGVAPFPPIAYIEAAGCGAAFDTRWLIGVSNSLLRSNIGLFLVHAHAGTGIPRFSHTDAVTNRSVVAKLSIGIDTVPYGAIVLSNDDQSAVVASNGIMSAASVRVVPDAPLEGWIA